LGQDWNFTLPVGVQTFIIYDVEVMSFTWIKSEPDVGEDLIIGTVILDQ
jgi:hypothetical protein